LTAVFAAVAVLISTFSATVNRELDEVDLEEGLSPDNESLAEEFERRRMEMEDGPKSKVQSPKREESPTPKAQGPKWEEDPGIRARTPEPEEAEPRPGSIRREPGARIPVSSPREESIFPSFESEDRDTLFRPPAPARPGPGAESGRRPITEEVKALVARMAREGHSAVEIARIADLTRTEVELILAVRAHNVEQLIESAGREEEEALDRGALYRAIGELHAEGRPPQDVARRLGISVAEVNLALAMMEKRGRGRR
jgi:DNA-binding CsgD family transcriptional regulator